MQTLANGEPATLHIPTKGRFLYWTCKSVAPLARALFNSSQSSMTYIISVHPARTRAIFYCSHISHSFCAMIGQKKGNPNSKRKRPSTNCGEKHLPLRGAKCNNLPTGMFDPWDAEDEDGPELVGWTTDP